MPETAKECKQRSRDNWMRKRQYDAELKDIYRFMMPYRDPAGLTGLETRQEGQQRTDEIFDGTAPAAALRFPGRFQEEFAPIFEDFFQLEPGPLVPDDQRDDNALILDRVGKLANAALTHGGFHGALHEMAQDLFAGTGAMIIQKNDAETPVKCRSVPIPQIALEAGPWGDICGWDWRKEYFYNHLMQMWPNGDFSATLKRQIADTPRGKVIVHQDTYYDPTSRDYKLKVWLEASGQDDLLYEETMRVTPWLTPRLFVAPGEVYGRGFAHLGLPFCKTLNKVREYALLAAAFSVMGLWMRRNDGSFNPDTVRFEPLAMWEVQSTGGALGPSLARLPTPENFDIQSFIIADERDQMKQVMNDVNLPPLAGSVRSPTEIAERMKLYSQDFGGMFGRLVMEIANPAARAAVSALEETGVLPSIKINIDQLLTRMKVVSPIAAGQQMGKVQRVAQWIEMINGMYGPQVAMLMTKPDEVAPEIGRWMGVDETFIPTKAEREQIQQAIAQLAAAAQTARQPPQQQPSPPTASQYMNGAAQ